MKWDRSLPNSFLQKSHDSQHNSSQNPSKGAGVRPVVEHMLSMLKALSSISSTKIKQQQKADFFIEIDKIILKL